MNIRSIDTIPGVEGFVDEHALAVAIASAIEDGLVEAKVYDYRTNSHRPAIPPPSALDLEADAAGQPPATYWFDLKVAGQDALKQGAGRLDAYLQAYFDAHPEERVTD